MGRFHPATSAFDGATSSTAYVLENEPKNGLEKEAGFDDVIDVSAAERKVDLLEEDPKLEEEKIRGKNVGGNELETEPGFDDVRDIFAAKTNAEAREKDLKLEEEVRGKNAGRKDLEKETGFGNDIDEQENEKMVKESVGKEIILEGDHFDVEKGIVDFVMPEKHDVDTNESTHGVFLEVDEAGCDLSKGREYRRKRKTRLLCSPYTDPDEEEKVVGHQCIRSLSRSRFC
ncbi:Hypothetical predicted protein [Olea europaea subsp. europaea]|uniref:Uncharacterized protein n=1 Tax=Olea europaea subsp. europaea TaxID=158383 RepID=A0A8S0TSM8_OLEEU|nr:Hypothetical predicted protein [Olea europaea subsp. europaea]